MTTMGKHSPPINGTLMPFATPLSLQPRGPVSVLPRPQDAPGQSRTMQDKDERRRPEGTAFIVVALFAVAQVAVVAFSGSWQHQYELSIHLGQAHWVAGMQPLSVEGLIASATLVIWYAARYKCGIPLGAYLVLAAGVGQTVLMNVGADYRWPWLGPEISVWPAVAFVAAYEMAVWLVRKRQDGAGVVQPVQPVQPDMDKPADRRVDKLVDKLVDKPAPRKAIPARTAMDKAAAAIRDNPHLDKPADKAELARIAGVSPKTIQRVRNGKPGSTA